MNDSSCRTLSLFLGLVVGLSPGALRAELKVLFVGNSFTQGAGDHASSVGGVPGIFDRLAQAGGQEDPTTVMRAVGGQDYQYHSQDPIALATIQSQPWDYVILQNYSTEPTHIQDGSHSLADHFTYGTLLYDQIMAHHAGTRVVLYETWSRAADHGLITGVSGPNGFASTDQFQEELRTNYQALATQLNLAHPDRPAVTVAGVGDSWQNAGGLRASSDPDYHNLHASDRYHGNDNGYYLAAAVFYAHVFGQSPVGLSTLPQVSGLKLNLTVPATFLEEVAWATVSAYVIPESETFLFDFGATDNRTVTGPAPDDPTRYWNNVSTDLGTTTDGVLTNVVDMQNRVSTVGLAMIRRFNGANGSGTTATTSWPVHATQDSLFGNTEEFSQQTNVFPAFKLTGLSTNREYRLTFHASRTGVSDNRETAYTVTASEESVVVLDAANNIDQVAILSGVKTRDGEITISLAPSANNNNGFHFTYLGILQVDAQVPQQPVVFREQPSDQTAVEFRPVTFTTAVSGTWPVFLQWFRNDVPLVGETQLNLTIPQVTLDLNDAAFTLTASNAISTVTSRVAHLTVLTDDASPTLVNVVAPDGRTLELEFSEAIQSASALDPTHYLVNDGDVEIDEVVFISDRMVVVTLSSSLTGAFHLVVAGILDLAGNSLATGMQWIGEISETATQPILIDFGASATAMSLGAPPDDPDRSWNNLTDTVGSAPGNILGPLVTQQGLPTEVSVVMLNRFNGANGNGSTASSLYPSDATRDSLFGNTETWGNLVNIFPAFKLTGLSSELIYTLVFYASRSGVSDNRETEFRVVGADTNLVYFNPANNIDASVTLANVAGSGAGEIAIYLSPGAANNNANHFTYLGVLEIQPFRLVGRFHLPTLQDGNIVLRWEGDGHLEEAIAWDGPWTLVQPAPVSPHVETVQPGQQRFYRLRKN